MARRTPPSRGKPAASAPHLRSVSAGERPDEIHSPDDPADDVPADAPPPPPAGKIMSLKTAAAEGTYLDILKAQRTKLAELAENGPATVQMSALKLLAAVAKEIQDQEVPPTGGVAATGGPSVVADTADDEFDPY